ncbi:unnamed protein product [Allacma fusca]|uniref:Uncharacterized protein n=1 Tax=Allacma fusca TaxID=39272 RepID=A0A8J2NKM9_9HEXA|nr:unnamed protein product [Allacma fusca]
MKFLFVAALVALAAAEPPVSYGAPPQSNYGAPGIGGNIGGNNGGNGPSSGYGVPGQGGPGGRSSAPIESDPNLELENEGINLPSGIVGQDLLDRVVDALSDDLAQQQAAAAAQRAATSGAYGAPNPGYGPPSTQYGPGGAPGGLGGGIGGSNGNGRIQLLIPPDPLKARLIANYIQRTTGPYTGSSNQNGAGGGGRAGSGYSNNPSGYN